MDKDKDKISKASFLLYNSYRVMVEALPDVDAGALMKAVFALAAGEEDPGRNLSALAHIVYIFIAQQMAEDEEKYNKRCESNRKSAAARWDGKKDADETAEPKDAAPEAQDAEKARKAKNVQSTEPAQEAENVPEEQKAPADSESFAESEEILTQEDTNGCERIMENANACNRMQSHANAYDNDNEYGKDNDLKEKDSFGVQKESVSAPPQPAVEIPLKNGMPYSVPESDLKEYQALYPGLDVIHECQKAARWCRDNPARQKTRQGVKRFLGSWLSRAAADSAQNKANYAQNGGKNAGNGRTAPKPNRFHNFDQRGTDYDALLRLVN